MKYGLITAAIASATAAMAQAAPDDSMTVEGGLVERVAVQTSELDTREGIDAVRLRVRRAAVRVCSIDPIATDVLNRKYCVFPALQDGYAQLNQIVEQRRSGALASAAGLEVRVR